MSNKIKRQIYSGLFVIVFLIPIIAGIVFFQYYPLAVAIKNSFTNINIMNPDGAKFVGWTNYVDLLENERFFRAIFNSFAYTIGKLAIQLPLALSLAILVNQEITGRLVLRTALFAPLVASEVVIAVIWNAIFFPDIGLLNSILNRLGFPTQGFITSSTQAFPSLLTTMIWQDIGFSVLLFLSGLQSIPGEYYEAAKIDGAGPWKCFRFITFPLLKRFIILSAFMATINGFKVFTPIYVMTQGGPQDSTISAIYLIYEQAFKYLNMGSASAMAVIFVLLLAVFTLLQSGILRTETYI